MRKAIALLFVLTVLGIVTGVASASNGNGTIWPTEVVR
ncbi:MAG: hypothetical protein K0R39_1787 [Symbiobacteriaceae bacterium]|jgi:hypothetical protein|nr:hypothetical protein [Symbiobacteriaceae bacterium]